VSQINPETHTFTQLDVLLTVQYSLPGEIVAHSTLKLATLRASRGLEDARCGGLFANITLTPHYARVGNVYFKQPYLQIFFYMQKYDTKNPATHVASLPRNAL
jgi:hypothetical protein